MPLAAALVVDCAHMAVDCVTIALNIYANKEAAKLDPGIKGMPVPVTKLEIQVALLRCAWLAEGADFLSGHARCHR